MKRIGFIVPMSVLALFVSLAALAEDSIEISCKYNEQRDYDFTLNNRAALAGPEVIEATVSISEVGRFSPIKLLGLLQLSPNKKWSTVLENSLNSGGQPQTLSSQSASTKDKDGQLTVNLAERYLNFSSVWNYSSGIRGFYRIEVQNDTASLASFDVEESHSNDMRTLTDCKWVVKNQELVNEKNPTTSESYNLPREIPAHVRATVDSESMTPEPAANIAVEAPAALAPAVAVPQDSSSPMGRSIFSKKPERFVEPGTLPDHE